ncbi:MAG TPA: OmpH family outer membrane protein [Candidatus Acidoferrum sp.]|nr:OmpH family outer membrane protein [Candidatus Acidoferrum sp.]
MNSRIMKYTAALAAAGLLIVAAVRGQSSSSSAAPASAAPGKVGVINIRGAIGNTAEGKQASAELQSQFAPRQTELENLNKQINDLRQRLGACEGKCSQDEIGRLTQQGQKATQKFDRLNTELNEDVQSAQGEVIDRIGRKMVDVLDRYSRENGFTLVLDSSAQNTPILYASTQVDVTQDIVRLYDAAYPVKAGAAPAQKPAAKPAPSTTPTKP